MWRSEEVAVADRKLQTCPSEHKDGRMAAPSEEKSSSKILSLPRDVVHAMLCYAVLYVQVHLVGTAAAMELGLDMSLYASFNLLDLHQSDEEEEDREGEGSRGGTATPGSAAAASSVAAAVGGSTGLPCRLSSSTPGASVCSLFRSPQPRRRRPGRWQQRRR